MINPALYSSRTEEWATPQEFFDRLDNEFHFTLDPCASIENKKCAKFYTKEQDGLLYDWTQDVVFCNPPYGQDIAHWCKKAYESSRGGATVLLLVPSRTDTRWFHDWVYGKAELRFVKGRLKFGDGKQSAPFPSLVAVFKSKK